MEKNNKHITKNYLKKKLKHSSIINFYIIGEISYTRKAIFRKEGPYYHLHITDSGDPNIKLISELMGKGISKKQALIECFGEEFLSYGLKFHSLNSTYGFPEFISKNKLVDFIYFLVHKKPSLIKSKELITHNLLF